MSLPSMNILHLTVSEIQPEKYYESQGHHGKVKSRSHLEATDLHPIIIYLPSITFLHDMVSKIEPGPDFKGEEQQG